MYTQQESDGGEESKEKWRERKKGDSDQRGRRGEVERYVKNTFVKCYTTKDVLRKMTD